MDSTEIAKMPQPSVGALSLFFTPALLLTESADEFEAVKEAFVEEIKPQNIIEHMHIGETAKITGEMLRLHRCKAAMINTAFRGALKNLLVKISKQPDEPPPYQESEALAFAWFTDPKVKQEVAEILGQFHLDETAIEAEAIRSLVPELETIDRMLIALEVRRNRSIRSIWDSRGGFAKRVQEVATRMIEAEPLLRLPSSDELVSA
jgi:hypothetical protein